MIRYQINCVECGDVFDAGAFFAKYCSGSCRAKHQYKRHRERDIRRSRERYFQMKDNDYEKLRRQNKVAAERQKDKTRFSGNRSVVLERDSNACRGCGKSTRLHVHHKDGTGYHHKNAQLDNRLSNLITLCCSCHHLLHWWQRKNNKILSQDEDIVRTLRKLKDAGSKSQR
jgi:hypothetical protein